MPEPGEVVEVHSGSSTGRWILLILAVLYVAGSLYFLFDLRGRFDQMSKSQAASAAQIEELGKRMQSAEAEAETLARTMEHEQHAVAAHIEARVEGVRQRAAAIDWS